MTATEQLGLFGPPKPIQVATPRQIEGARWSSYHPVNRVQCQHCVQVTHERRGAGPVDIRTARHKRTTADGDLFLCKDHAEIQRAKDEESGLIGKAKDSASRTRKPKREAS